MIHTSEQALEAAREILDRYKVKHTGIGTPEPKAGYQRQPGTLIIDIWVVVIPIWFFRKKMRLFI